MLEAKGFHTVTLWGPMAEVAGKYLKPGGQVFISGRLQTDSWEDTKTNEKRSKTKIIGMDMILLDPKDGMRSASADTKPVLANVNRTDIIGNVTKDPEMRTTTNGHKVLTLGVATNERWKDKSSGEDKERSEFHNIVLWGELAEQVAKSVKKGNRAYVSGRVQTRSWETKEGQKRYTTEIIAETFNLLGVRNPIVESSISMDGAPRAASTRDESMDQSAPAESSVEVPAIQYASEIKAEDLPF